VRTIRFLLQQYCRTDDINNTGINSKVAPEKKYVQYLLFVAVQVLHSTILFNSIHFPCIPIFRWLIDSHCDEGSASCVEIHKCTYSHSMTTSNLLSLFVYDQEKALNAASLDQPFRLYQVVLDN
jgi:hypothetical protein